MHHFDYIIVGGGLAGCTLAYKLSLINKEILLFWQDEQGQASKVASGVVNPIVLKTLNKVWKADELLNITSGFYSNLEEILNNCFFHKLEIIRLFNSIFDYNEWTGKASDVNYLNYLDINKIVLEKNIINDFGYGILKNCYWLDTKKYLALIEKNLNDKGILRKEKLDYNTLKISDNGLIYKEITASKIIFCEGAFAINNPYFPKKALKPVKGEELTINYSGNINYAYKKQLMLLPINNSQAKIGSNYEWDYTHPFPDTNIAQEFITDLKKMLGTDSIKILNHEAGIRPASRDRKPLLGRHPKIKNMYFLNGLGTRGVMLAPYLSELLINFCENNIPIDEEIDMSRMFKYYKNY